MYFFGDASRAQLATVDEQLKKLAYYVLTIKDHSVIKGHRTQAQQDAAFEGGYSKVRWPDGKHNKLPSRAMDVQVHPRPSDPQALREEQIYLLGIYAGVAKQLGIKIRTGGDWDCDGEIADNKWDDLFHIELMEYPHCGYEHE